MSRENWAERYSNQERCIFEKGNWRLTKDGENTLSLYFDEDYVDPKLYYNNYKLFQQGFLLYFESPQMNSYCLYSSSSRKPIFAISAQNAKIESDANLLFFYIEDKIYVYDTDLMLPVVINKDEQIQLDL